MSSEGMWAKIEEILEIAKSRREELERNGWIVAEPESPRWWAGLEDPASIAVSAVLVQGSRWEQAERALMRIKHMLRNPPTQRELEEALSGSLAARRKAAAIISLLEALPRAEPSERFREELISLPGIGPETADAIMLYALNYPTFPVSRQARRVMSRLGLKLGSYEAVRKGVLEVTKDLGDLKMLHAFLVTVARLYCKPSRPRCGSCPLAGICATSQ